MADAHDAHHARGVADLVEDAVAADAEAVVVAAAALELADAGVHGRRRSTAARAPRRVPRHLRHCDRATDRAGLLRVSPSLSVG